MTTLEQKQQRMIEEAKQAALTSAAWFSLDELAALAEVPAPDLEVLLAQWKNEGLLFSVMHEGVELFPSYVFAGDKLEPFTALAPILAVLGSQREGWGLAYWFSSVNGMLGGSSPQDVLQAEPEQVLLAAQDEVLGVTHG